MIIKNKKIFCIATTAFYNDRGCHVRIERVYKKIKKNNELLLLSYSKGRDRIGINNIRINKVFKNEKDYIGFNLRKIILDLYILKKAITEIRKNNFDNTLAFTHEAGILALFIYYIFGIKYYLDYQGSLYNEIIKYKKGFILLKPFIKFIESKIEKNADIIIFNTKFNFEKIKKEKKIFIDDNYFPEKEKYIHTFREHEKEKIILWIGVFSKVQGIKELFTLIKSINDKNIKFVIIGFPVRDKYIEELKKYNVVFTGKINWEFIPNIIRDADICISTKLNSSEGSSKLFLYKKYCKNIIAFKNLGTEEILENESFIVSSIDEMKNEILKRLKKE